MEVRTHYLSAVLHEVHYWHMFFGIQSSKRNTLYPAIEAIGDIFCKEGNLGKF